MQVAMPEPVDLHVCSHWNADDQALLDILLLSDPAETPPMQDVHMQVASSLSEVTATTAKALPVGKDEGLKSKLSAFERRVRHREVVKRAYHRNKVGKRGCDSKYLGYFLVFNWS